MGHELIGVVEDTGEEVGNVARAQAELVRRSLGLRRVPEQLSGEQALFLTDILPS